MARPKGSATINMPLVLPDIKEGYDICQGCGKKAFLGNGLCQKCWDKQSNKRGNYPLKVSEVE